MVGLDGYLTNSMWIYTSEQHLVSLCASLSIGAWAAVFNTRHPSTGTAYCSSV